MVGLLCFGFHQRRKEEREREREREREDGLTKLTEASAARARISAQETTPGQTYSTVILIASITSKPRRELLFGGASFSLTIAVLLSSKTDPSQP